MPDGPAKRFATGNSILTATEGSRRKVRLARFARELGSYAAIVLMLPSGNLIGLALWMLQHRAWLAASARRGLSAAWTAAARHLFPR